MFVCNYKIISQSPYHIKEKCIKCGKIINTKIYQNKTHNWKKYGLTHIREILRPPQKEYYVEYKKNYDYKKWN